MYEYTIIIIVSVCVRVTYGQTKFIVHVHTYIAVCSYWYIQVHTCMGEIQNIPPT